MPEGDGLTSLRAVLQAAVDQGVAPGFSLAFARLGAPLRTVVAGRTGSPVHHPGAAPVTPRTVYDLASLTKPLQTTAAAMLLVDEGRIRLDDDLRRLLGLGAAHPLAGVRLRHLLAHEAGLPWWLPLYREVVAPDGPTRRRLVLERVLALSPEAPPGQRTVYSDPGFLLLGHALEQAAGGPLGPFVAQRLWRPLGVDVFAIDLDPGAAGPREDTARLHDEVLAHHTVAPTERCPWRGRVLQAEVHDENAWHLGGIAPHAGLFGTASDVAAFGLGLLAAGLGRSDLAGAPSQEVVQTFWRGGGRPGGATWALGWDRPSSSGSSGGQRVHPRAVSHLGFTGTSLWLDPVRCAAVALLSNRVHPSRDDLRIKKLRPTLHDAVWTLLDEEE